MNAYNYHEPIKFEPYKPEPIKLDTYKFEPFKFEPYKPEPIKLDAYKFEPIKFEPYKPEPIYNNLYSHGGTKSYKQDLCGNVKDIYGTSIGKRDGFMIRDPLGHAVASVSCGGLLQPAPAMYVPMFGHHP